MPINNYLLYLNIIGLKMVKNRKFGIFDGKNGVNFLYWILNHKGIYEILKVW